MASVPTDFLPQSHRHKYNKKGQRKEARKTFSSTLCDFDDNICLYFEDNPAQQEVFVSLTELLQFYLFLITYSTGSSALEMRCCLKPMSEKTGKISKYVAHLGKHKVLRTERRKKKR